MEENKILPGDARQKTSEVVCIWVTKIFDACSQKECEEFLFEDLDFPEGDTTSYLVECCIRPGSEKYTSWPIEPIDGGPLGRVRVRVCATLQIIIRAANNPSNYTTNDEEICFAKEVILYAPAWNNMEVLVESIFESLACSIREDEDLSEETFPLVVATVGAFIVVKTALWVQLLVPAFGFCPVPPECAELGSLCEQFLERPFPPLFPAQAPVEDKKPLGS